MGEQVSQATAAEVAGERTQRYARLEHRQDQERSRRGEQRKAERRRHQPGHEDGIALDGLADARRPAGGGDDDAQPEEALPQRTASSEERVAEEQERRRQHVSGARSHEDQRREREQQIHSARQRAPAEFGWRIARGLSRLHRAPRRRRAA